jgi:uncharacterized membrane protein/YHS domain-containing protein
MKPFDLRIAIVLSTLLMAANVTALTEPLSDQAPANEYCPVTTSEKADPNIFVDFEGQRIHFCCQKCKRDFLADPEEYIGNLKLASTEPTSDKPAQDAQEGEMSGSSSAGGSPDGHDHQHEVSGSDTGSPGLSTDTSGEAPHDADHESARDHQSREDAEHDHATDHGSKSGIVAFLGKFHPVVVHFPIALVIMAGIFLLSRSLLGLEVFNQMAAITMYWAALFAVVAALLGLARASGADFPSFLAEYFQWHRLLGLVSAGLTVGTAIAGLVWRRRGSGKAKTLFVVLLVLNVIAIGITGHLGATLVYGPDYYNL